MSKPTQFSYGWIVVGAGAMMTCVGFGAMLSLAVFLQPISTAMGWSRSGVSAAATIDFLAMGFAAFFWGVVALTLIYSAYVSEVYRAGIESVHPSQDAAARSLGLSRFQSMRHVVLPQAIRRVVPPLLNDFIGLQKDTVLVSFIGVVEIFRTAQIKQAALFNFTPYMGVAFVFLVLTIPLARFTDWLVAREKRRVAAGGGR